MGPASRLSLCPRPPQRLCLNGSTGQEVVVRKDLQNVEALSFDPVSRLLYWVDAGAQKIEVIPKGGLKNTRSVTVEEGSVAAATEERDL